MEATCFHVVFFLEEINHATVLGMQDVSQKMLFLFLQGKYPVTETQPSFPVRGSSNPDVDKYDLLNQLRHGSVFTYIWRRWLVTVCNATHL